MCFVVRGGVGMEKTNLEQSVQPSNKALCYLDVKQWTECRIYQELSAGCFHNSLERGWIERRTSMLVESTVCQVPCQTLYIRHLTRPSLWLCKMTYAFPSEETDICVDCLGQVHLCNKATAKPRVDDVSPCY